MRAWLLVGWLVVGCSSEQAAVDGKKEDANSPPVAAAPTEAETSQETPDVEAPLPPPPESIQLDVPYIAQKPELPRGCEVTSLGMVLRYYGVNADKMKLAKEIDKVPYESNGLRGDPNEAFVGNMYTFDKPGYGAYHAPVERLAAQYLPGKVLKLTGSSFDELLANHVGRKRPVWIITNATWAKLPASEMETWNTKNGKVQITWHEHSVVITGYDPASVYINDPLDPKRNKKLDRTKFREAWEQMGKQAIAFAP